MDGPDDSGDAEASCSESLNTLQTSVRKKRRPNTDSPAPESFSTSSPFSYHGSSTLRASRGRLTLSQASSSRSSSNNHSSQKPTPLTTLDQLELTDPKVLFRAPPSLYLPPKVRTLKQVFSDNKSLVGFVPNFPDALAQLSIFQVSETSIRKGAPILKDSDFFAHALDIFHTIRQITSQFLDEQN
jgi:hypothetical protein